MADKILTEKANQFKKNGWIVRRKHKTECHVIERHYRRSESEEWRLLGRYAY